MKDSSYTVLPTMITADREMRVYNSKFTSYNLKKAMVLGLCKGYKSSYLSHRKCHGWCCTLPFSVELLSYDQHEFYSSAKAIYAINLAR